MLENIGGWWKKQTSQYINHINHKKTQPVKHSYLKVTTDLKNVEQVLEWFEQFNRPDLQGNYWWQCQTALVEAFTNTVRHAHKNLPPTTPIELEVTMYLQHLDIRIWDYGKPFNFQAKLQEIIDNPAANPLEKEGGRGLIFMQKLTDEVRYIRQPDERNCLEMRKIFPL